MIADRNRSDVVFQVEDKILLKLQPYTQYPVVTCPFPKPALRYYGRFTIVGRVGPAAYKLGLPLESLIHPTFHVCQLKQLVPDFTPAHGYGGWRVDLIMGHLTRQTRSDPSRKKNTI